MSIIQDLSDANPTTVTEGLYFIILTSLSSIMLLRPDSILFIRGIEIPPVLEQPGWISLLVLMGSPCILLLTKYGKWVIENTN